MADLMPAERLQPSLLDRLTDDEPDKLVEARDRHMITTSKLREIIMRDLAWLLNTGNLATVEDLSAFPEAARSVINYGVRDLSGLLTASLDAGTLERELRQAIVEFEPRILSRRLRVEANVQRDQMNRSALVFRIEGELWSQPAPVGLSLKTEIDVESRRIVVVEPSG